MFLSVLHLGCINFHKYWTPYMHADANQWHETDPFNNMHQLYKKLYILLILNDKQ